MATDRHRSVLGAWVHVRDDASAVLTLMIHPVVMHDASDVADHHRPLDPVFVAFPDQPAVRTSRIWLAH